MERNVEDHRGDSPGHVDSYHAAQRKPSLASERLLRFFQPAAAVRLLGRKRSATKAKVPAIPKDERGPRLWRMLVTTVLGLATSVFCGCYWVVTFRGRMPTVDCRPPGPTCVAQTWALMARNAEKVHTTSRESWMLALLVVAYTFVVFLVHVNRADEKRARKVAHRRRAIEGGLGDAAVGRVLSPMSGRPSSDGKLASTTPESVSRLIRTIFISPLFLWFFCYLPAFLLFGGMVWEGYEDAVVLALAFAAIFVAAEHYSSLEQQHKLVETQRTVLHKIQNELSEGVASIANSLGHSTGIKVIYEAYRDPHRPQTTGEIQARLKMDYPLDYEVPIQSERGDPCVYSIYRFFDIDDEWWSSNNWGEYCGRRSSTLFNRLVDGHRIQLTYVAPFIHPLFEAEGAKRDRALFFKKFIGLVWHFAVLWQVRDCLERNSCDHCEHCIRIADTSLWLHVIDRSVYQIMGNETGKNVKVRDLTIEMEAIASDLVRWARREIEALARRGAAAEEYICSCLIDAHKSIPTDGNATLDGYEEALLRRLGFEDWWEERFGPQNIISHEHCIHKCSTLIRDAIAIIVTGSASGRGRPCLDGAHNPTIKELAKEIE